MEFDTKSEVKHIQENGILSSQQFEDKAGHYMRRSDENQSPKDEDKKPLLTSKEHQYQSPSNSFSGNAHFNSVSLESSKINPSVTNETSQTRSVNLEEQCAEFKENFDPEKYTCGGCNRHFSMVCQLHHHLMTHLESGRACTYIYNITTKTAYPRFNTICRAVQTFDSKSDFLIDNPIQEQDGNSENETVEDVPKEQNKIDRNKDQNKAFGYSSTCFVKSRRKYKRLSDKSTDGLLSLTKSSKYEQDENNENAMVDNVPEVQNKIDGNKDQKKAIRHNSKGFVKSKIKAKRAKDNGLLSPTKHLKLEKKCSGNNEYQISGEKFKPNKPNVSVIKADIVMNLSSSARNEFITDKIKQNEGSEKDLLYTGYCSDDNKIDKLMNDSDTDLCAELNFYNEDTEKNGGETEKNYKCKDCGKSYKFESKLDIHRVQKHGGKKQVMYNCRWCHETFKFKKQLLNHVVSCSRNEGLKCSICGKVFPSKSDRIKHMTSHQNDKDLTCKICGKVAEKWQLMEAHIKRCHWTKSIQCDKCGKAFQYKNLLKKHKVYCNEEKPISCPKCDMRFRTVFCWRKHYAVHTDEKPFVCQYCGYTGKKLEYLKRHIRTHTGEKPFKCQICGMAFRALNGLTRHNKIHKNVRSCVCQYCGKAFSNNWNLKTHIRQHTGDKPYKCSECGQGFKQNVLLKLHVKSHHPNI